MPSAIRILALTHFRIVAVEVSRPPVIMTGWRDGRVGRLECRFENYRALLGSGTPRTTRSQSLRSLVIFRPCSMRFRIFFFIFFSPGTLDTMNVLFPCTRTVRRFSIDNVFNVFSGVFFFFFTLNCIFFLAFSPVVFEQFFSDVTKKNSCRRGIMNMHNELYSFKISPIIPSSYPVRRTTSLEFICKSTNQLYKRVVQTNFCFKFLIYFFRNFFFNKNKKSNCVMPVNF